MQYLSRENKTLSILITISIFSSLLIVIFDHNIAKALPSSAYFFTIFWLIVAVAFSFDSYREFCIGMLLTTFCMLIGWRITQTYDIKLPTFPLFAAFALLLINFIRNAYMNITQPGKSKYKLSLQTWQLIFVRIYLGFNFIPHFTEKLFAGKGPHLAGVNAVISLGVPYPCLLVWLAGLCEFAAALSLSTGFLMRLGSLSAVVYLMIATYLGHHLGVGFIWAMPGGGWEFAIMWTVLILGFLVTGSHDFSIDGRLADKVKLPAIIKKLL